MMKYIPKLCAATALVAFIPTSAIASCDLSVISTGETRIKSYNALSRQTPHEPIRIKLSNNGDEDCLGQLSFNYIDGEASLRGPQGSSLEYLIVDERDYNRVLFEPFMNQRNTVLINIRPDKTIEISPKFVMRRGQAGNSGIYRARVEATFIETNRPDYTKQAVVNLSADVVPTVQANFVGVSYSGEQNGTSLLALGEITPDMRRSIGLQLRSNTDVDIEVSSLNQGMLMSENTGEAAKINYHMSVGGRNLDLSAQSDIVLPTSVSPRGVTSRIDIKLENFTDKPAGNYGDTILFRITAR